VSASCQSPLALDTLIAYWLGEMDSDTEEQTEEHYIGCAYCSQRLEQLEGLAQGIRQLARTSGVNMIANDAFVRRLTEDGLHVREYRVPLNGSVNCTVAAEDDFVVGRLEVPLAGVQRVDLLTLDGDGDIALCQEDIPFVAESDNVVFIPGIDVIRAMPKSTLHVRLLAVDDMGEHILGDYKFNHTPDRSQNSD